MTTRGAAAARRSGARWPSKYAPRGPPHVTRTVAILGQIHGRPPLTPCVRERVVQPALCQTGPRDAILTCCRADQKSPEACELLLRPHSEDYGADGAPRLGSCRLTASLSLPVAAAGHMRRCTHACVRVQDVLT